MSKGRDIHMCTMEREPSSWDSGCRRLAGWLDYRTCVNLLGAMSWKNTHIRSQRTMLLCLDFILKIVGATVGLNEGGVMIILVS